MLDLIEAQYKYHTQAKEYLENLKNNWGQGSCTDPRDFMGQVIARKSSAGSYHSASTDNVTSHYRVTPANSAMSRDSSLDTFSSSSVTLRNNGSSDPLPNNVLPPAYNKAPPSRQCKCLFFGSLLDNYYYKH